MSHADEETLERFAEYHRDALMVHEARHNIMLALLDLARADPKMPITVWSLGGPGACALRAGTRPIVLGDLDRRQCARLAREVATLGFPGAVGPDFIAQWFAEAATVHGLAFDEPMPQRIHKLDRAPTYPDAPGAARRLGRDDAPLFHRWTCAFAAEAVPHDPTPPEAETVKRISSGNGFFWEVDDVPVSMAALVRETENTGTISHVYTPPEHRGRGYAGSVSAAVAGHIFAKGKRLACLYTDLRNPYSNRCYEKIGFRPVCDALFYPRAAS